MNRCSDHIAHYTLDAEHFDYFANEDATDRAYDTLFRKFLSDLARTGKTVVDIGSGSGWTSMIPHDLLCHIDLSERNLSRLQSGNTAGILADAMVLPFKDSSVDLVIASEILEHLNSPGAAAEEIIRVLKPGGRAIISTPYRERLRYTLCIHCNQPTPLNAHLHSFDKESLTSLFPNRTASVHLFGSKILTSLRAARLFSKLPLWVWKVLNYPLLKLVDRAQHVVIEVEK